MYHFVELINRSTTFSLAALKEANERTSKGLTASNGATAYVRNLQMLRLHKIIVAVGMFSIFEANLQSEMGGDGFAKAESILDSLGKVDLKKLMRDLRDAINVLKHGRGRSYDRLVGVAPGLSFRIKLPGENFFFEGDVSEVDTLIDVDDAFVQGCASLISDVSMLVSSEFRRRSDLAGRA